MKTLALLAVSAIFLMSCSKKELAIKNPPPDTATTVTYTESTQDIVNPERGFFQYAEIHSSNYIPLSESLLAGYRNNSSLTGATYTVSCSLVFVEYVLDSFVTSPISADFLSKFDQDCATARLAGVKLIPRFIYTNTTHTGSCPDQTTCPPYRYMGRKLLYRLFW